MPKFAKGHRIGFKAGQSGNPGGRPRALPELVDACRAHTPEAIETLVRILGDAEAPPSAQIMAANALLDRAWGKPTQPVGDGEGGPLQVVIRRMGDAAATA